MLELGLFFVVIVVVLDECPVAIIAFLVYFTFLNTYRCIWETHLKSKESMVKRCGEHVFLFSSNNAIVLSNANSDI